MKTQDLLSFALNDLKREKARILTSILGIVMGVAVVHFMLSLGAGIGKIIREKFLLDLSENYLVVKPQSVDLSVLKFEGRMIYDKDVESFRKLNGIKDVYPTMIVDFPVSFYANLFGEFIGADTPVLGVDERLINKGESLKDFKYEGEVEYIPAILSPLLLEIYNTGYAVSNQLPKLTEKVLIGRHLTLVLGESTIHPRVEEKYKEIKCKIIGLSSKATSLGITIPLRYVKEFNEWYNNQESGYNALYIETEKNSNAALIMKQIENAGFFVEPYDKSANRINLIVRLGTFLLSGVGIVILLFSAMNIFNVVMLKLVEKEKEFKIYRVLGAKKIDIRRMLNLEFLMLSILGSMLGVIVGFISIQVIEFIFSRFIPNFLFKPESLFRVGFLNVIIPFFIGIFFGMVAILLAGRKMFSDYPIEY